MSEEKKEKPEDPRAAEILKLKIAGYTRPEIAEEIGVSERTVYNITRRPTYLSLLEDNRTKYDAIMNRLEESEQTTIQLEILKERGRRDRSATKILADAAIRKMEHTPDPEICRRCVISKRRDTTQLIEDIRDLIGRKRVKQQRRLGELLEEQVSSDTPYTRAIEELR